MEGDYRLALGSTAGCHHAGSRHDGDRDGVLVRLAPAFALAGLLAVPSPAFAPFLVEDGFAGDEAGEAHGGEGVQSAEGVPGVRSGFAEGRSGGAGTGTGTEGREKVERQDPAAPGKLPLIVTLQVGEGTEAEHGDDPVAAVTARVMKRLETVMSAEDLAAVRTFSVLPIIALSADRDLIVRLLSMPEVASVERDREFRTPGEAESASELPAAEPEFRLESSGEPGSTLNPPILGPKSE